MNNPELNPYYEQTEIVRVIALELYEIYPAKNLLKEDQFNQIQQAIQTQGLRGLIRTCSYMEGFINEFLRTNNGKDQPTIQKIIEDYQILNKLAQEFGLNYEFTLPVSLESQAVA